LLIEAAVESVEAALAAVEGGAHRIELCSNLAAGGTTPPVDLLLAAKSKLPTPIFVLVRPRPGDFIYTDAEHRTMLGQIETAKGAGARGIVTGALTARRVIDERRVAELIHAARPLAVTFHRALEECADLPAALEVLIRLGVDRVLTSKQIGKLVLQAAGRIVIIAGGGINPDNVARIVQETGVREIHFSVKDAKKVRDVLESL
jgi:copper homeostasis protein